MISTRLGFILAALLFCAAAGEACEIASQRVNLEEGSIAYSRAGAGTPILLLHGLFAQKEQWNALLCLLAEGGYSAIAPDLPGFGQSVDFPTEDYRLDRQAMLLHRFMAALGVETYHLAGSSMGGAIAALYARDYHREVRSLAFIGAPLGMVEWGPSVKNAIFQGTNPFIPVDDAQFDLEMRLLFMQPPEIPPAVKAALVREYVDHNRHYQQVWDIVNLYGNLFRGGPWGGKATLILWGVEDRIFAVDGAVPLKRRFPRGQLRKLSNAGHLLLMENADAVAALYLRFLRNKH